MLISINNKTISVWAKMSSFVNGKEFEIFEPQEKAGNEHPIIEQKGLPVFDKMPPCMVLCDRDLKVLTANSCFSSYFNGQQNEIVGVSLPNLVPLISTDERNCFVRQLQLAFEKGTSTFKNFIYSPENGKKIRVNINAVRLCTGEERYLLIIIDATQNEGIVGERQIRLQRFAEIGSLVAGIAHEINNPLDGALRLTRISLGKVHDDDFLKECLVTSKNGLEKACRIVNSLFKYCKNFHSKIVEIDVNELIEEILELTKYVQVKRNIKIEKKLGENLPLLKTLNNIDQVLINIVKNAFDAMKDGGTLTIETSHDGKYVMVKISDTGPGMTKDVLGRIGTPFFTTKPDGTGLGISICKEILRLLGGKMKVESAASVGTTFTIMLPYKQKENVEQIREESRKVE